MTNPQVSASEILSSVFGFSEFRGNQAEIVSRAINGQHSLVIMPTGGGKSLCYQIPAIALAKSATGAPQTGSPLTIVLSPLIALMKDQVDALTAKGVDATFINSSLDRQNRQERYRGLADGKYDILYVTPERFRKPEFREVLSSRAICLLAVDEAHCISQWGHDFRPDYTRVAEIREFLGCPPTVALTATATREVQSDIVQQLGLKESEIKLFHEGIDRPNLSLGVTDVWDDEEKLEKILEVNQRHPSEGNGVVYFTLIKTLYRFSDYLQEKRLDHLIYHGDLPRRERRAVQDRFVAESGNLVLATNAFGMGIDKADIRFVVHADLPGSLEAYYQEIGRAGRDGLPSECLLLYNQADLATQMEFMKWSNPDVDFYARLHDFLSHDLDSVNAFGIEWLRERLHAKQKHDRRLETALGMLDRFGAIEGSLHPFDIRSVGKLPEELRDADKLSAKLLLGQKKLLALVEFANTDEDRKAFLNDYFMKPPE